MLKLEDKYMNIISFDKKEEKMSKLKNKKFCKIGKKTKTNVTFAISPNCNLKFHSKVFKINY